MVQLQTQGYGLTETCAASFLAGPFPGHSGTVGPPVPGTEYRLEGSSELGYALDQGLQCIRVCIMLGLALHLGMHCSRVYTEPGHAFNLGMQGKGVL